jgi:hypothetical protein
MGISCTHTLHKSKSNAVGYNRVTFTHTGGFGVTKLRVSNQPGFLSRRESENVGRVEH